MVLGFCVSPHLPAPQGVLRVPSAPNSIHLTPPHSALPASKICCSSGFAVEGRPETMLFLHSACRREPSPPFHFQMPAFFPLTLSPP